MENRRITTMSMQDEILEAYMKRKKEGFDNSTSSHERIIKTLEPIRITNSLHVIKSPGSPPSITDKWWTKPPAVAGESCTATQRRLCQEDSFTGIHKKKYNSEESCAITGDFCYQPRRAARILKGDPIDNIASPSRTGDFRTEVEWRLQLRPQFN